MQKKIKNFRIRRINLYIWLIILIIFCIFEYGIKKVCSFTMYPDEFGYWASAAEIVGYDWSELASLGSYYSFGYSLILIPILKLFADGVMAYRAAIFINMLLMCGSFFLFQQIIARVFSEKEAEERALISGVASLYPAWIFYMQMTMTEAILFFLFAFDAYLLLRFMEEQKPLTGMGLAVSLIYGYSVHMRTVGVIIACAMVLFCWFAIGKGKKKTVFIWLGFFVLLGGLSLWLKGQTITTVFSHAEAEVLAGNDYSSQWNKFVDIFTFSGIIQLFCEVIGKLYYLGLSSFGIFYWALFWCVKESVCPLVLAIKKREPEKIQARQWLAFFLLLSVIGQIMISSIYMHGTGVIDGLIYGRYNEFLVPVMILIGFVVMSRSRFLIPIAALMGMVLGGVTLLLLRVIERGSLSGIRGYHIPGVSYFAKEVTSDVPLYFRNTWLLCFGLMLLVSTFIWLGNRRPGAWWLYVGIMIIEIAAGLQISNHYTYTVNNVNFENQLIAERVKENSAGEIDILYLEEGYPPFVDLLQMQIPARSIHVITEEELNSIENMPCIVITHADTRQDEVLKELFDRKVSTKLFCLYYNQ